MKLTDIIKGSEYDLSLFTEAQISELESRIVERQTKKGVEYYITCVVRKKDIKATPEEVVRQLYLLVLTNDLGYPVSRMELEYEVTFGREKKRADIVIFDKQQTTSPYIIVEVKKPKLKDGKEQLKSYCNATGAPIGVWSNGHQISYYHRKDPNYFEDLSGIPRADQKLSHILSERWKIADLIKKDKLVNERKSLKDLILEMEDEVLANAGVDVFEEVFKLIFTKLFDEMESGRKPDRNLEFRNYGDTETELKDKLQALFDKAKEKWQGVFTDDAKLLLTPSHLSVCVASLQDVKLFNSNLDVVDEAFEYLINKSSKGEKGQYFTPRYVIDMCVKMLNPKVDEKMIDTAAGSCGFPVHTIFHVWENILKSKDLNRSHLFTLEEKPAECTDYVQDNVFAIDFDEKAVRVARTLNLIAGDGQTNVMHLNTLDYERWDETVKDEIWSDTYSEGWKKLKKLRTDKNSNRDFNFDIIMANPPFAGDIKESRILAKYDLSRSVSLEKLKNAPQGANVVAGEPTFPEALNNNGETVYQMSDGTFRKTKLKQASNMNRDILFVERNLDFLKPGGRMAIVLPQGRFNNSSDKSLREYIADRCRILAVVGLHGNVFKPHTGTKTSVLFVQKWDEELCPKVDDYNIFFATMQEPSKDNSGDKIYRNTIDEDGNNVPLLDSHGHLIVKHDLFNHDGKTPNGIAEAFAEFAKKERLSFFRGCPFDEVKYKTLLEGLEICEKKLSEVKIDNQTFRFDSEFFSIQYLEILRMLNGLATEKLEDVTTWITQGPNPFFTEEGTIPCLTGRNINQGRVIYENADFISEQEYNNLSRFQLEQGDTLITLKGKGSIGKIGFVTEKKNAIFSRNIGIVRPNKEINAAYLNAYILSKFGQNMVLRGETGGTGQSTLTCSYLKSLDIPRIENENVIGNLVWQSEKVFQSAKSAYSEAESYLLECLGMTDFAANPDAYNIKTLKESFLETGRFDSEYYLPKYEDYIELVHSYPNGYDLIGNVCDIKDNNYTPANGIQYKYIELANIGKSGEITDCNELTGEQLPTRARRIVHKGDVIVSSIEGSLDSCALVTDEYDGALCSTGFYVLKSHQHNPETLLTLFKSLPIQNLMKKGCSGTILTAIGKSEFEKIPVPLIRKEVQEEIAKHVQKSIELRMEAVQLLENAKLTVETIIENGGGNLLIYNRLQANAFEEWNHAVWLLFTEIGITSDIDVKTSIVSTYKKLSNSFLKSGRLDAEYYQPKYDHLFSELKRFKTKTIRQIATLSKSIEPGSDAYCEKGIPFIRVADLSKFGLSEPAVYLDKLEFKDTIRPKKDTILLSKDGSVGIAYKVEEPIDVITSGAIIHLNITDKEVLPDYLTLILNSFVVKLQAERDAGGSIIQHWKPSEIEDVIIPILPTSEQVTISKMLQQSFSLRKETKSLLQEAIQIVETTIEKN